MVILKYYLLECKHNYLSLICTIVVIIALLLIVFGELIAPYDPEKSISGAYLLPPSSDHLFGTDSYNLDIFSRVIVAPKYNLGIAFTASVIAFLLGAPFGLIAGYYSGHLSQFISRILDVIQAFPIFIIAMAMVAIRGPSIINVIVVIAVLNAPIYFKLIRNEAVSLRSRFFVESSQCSGANDYYILVKHILPNSIAPAVVQFSLNIGMAIILTAALSFIGAGVRVPTPEWGAMIAVGYQNIITGQWWTALFPGLAIGITVYAFSVVSSTLDKILDPSRRGNI